MSAIAVPQRVPRLGSRESKVVEIEPSAVGVKGRYAGATRQGPGCEKIWRKGGAKKAGRNPETDELRRMQVTLNTTDRTTA